MRNIFLALLALLPLSHGFPPSCNTKAHAAARSLAPELYFPNGYALGKRDESSGATVNALNTATASFIKLTATVTTINGAVAPASPESRMIILSNQTGGEVTISHESASATAADRFHLTGAEDQVLADGAPATFIYDHGMQRWVPAGGGGGGASEAPDLDYAPTTPTDWTDPDPVNGQEALDQLADRTTLAEAAVIAAQETADDHIADTTGAHAATAISVTPTGDLAADDVQEALQELQVEVTAAATAISDHVADATGAHAASAIAVTPTGDLAADDVQEGLQELQAEVTAAQGAADDAQTDIDNHIVDAAGAHAASAISVTPTGDLAADDVQEALQELQGDVDTLETDVATAQQAADDAQADIDAHLIDATGAHAASAISVTPAGDLAADDVQEALQELQTDVNTRIADPGSAQNGMSLQREGGSAAWRAQAQRKNWLVNESFEYATADSGWTTSAATFSADTGTKIFGAQSMKMSFTSGAGSISQSVTPPVDYAGKSIQHTAWIKTTDSDISVCSLRAGTTYECKKAPADGIWHEVGFTYTDPGTGTRGITISRTTGGASDTWIDGVYVGPYEPNVPAVVNVGGSFVGGIIYPTTANCSWSRSTTSISWGGFSADSDCPVPTGSNIVGGASVPTTKIPAIRLTNLDAGNYQVVVNGWVGSSSSTRPCHWRVSDGTSASNISSGNGDINQFSASYLLRRTTSGDAEIQVQATGDGALGNTGTCIINPDSSGRDLSIMVYKMPDATSLAGSIITQEPIKYLSTTCSSWTRVTSTPTAECTYRSYQQSGGGSGVPSDAAPGASPAAGTGFAIGAFDYNSSGSGTFNISRYEIYIGKGLNPAKFAPRYFTSTGHLGAIDVNPNKIYSYLMQQGVATGYDPATGVLNLDAVNSFGTGSGGILGFTSAPNAAASVYAREAYVDVELISNPLAVGLSSAENEIKFLGQAARVSTYFMQYTNVAAKGSAMSYELAGATGTAVTINEDGYYNIRVAHGGGNSQAVGVGVSKNYSTAVDFDGIPDDNRVTPPSYSGALSGGLHILTSSASTYLKKGDVLRVHVNGTNSALGALDEFSVSKAPSPFEVVGGAGARSPLRTFGGWVGGSGTPYAQDNDCGVSNGSPCEFQRFYDDDGNTDYVVTKNSTGNYTMAIPSGRCSVVPVCTMLNNGSGGSRSFNMGGVTPSTTSFTFMVQNATPSPVNWSGTISCFCKR